MNDKILQYKLKGYCCSQIITAMGLEAMGLENPDYVKASAGLCFGLGHGKDCGIVSAALCLMYLGDPEKAHRGLADDFIAWFESEFESIQCEELLGSNPLNKVEKCPMMIENAFLKLSDLMDWDLDQ
jgi:hypothetical protein